MRDLLERRWASRAGDAAVETEQALIGDLDALRTPSPEVRWTPPKGVTADETVALLERMRTEESDERLWQGVAELKAENGRVRLDFQPPHDPQLAPDGEVDVACHLYHPPS